MIARLALQFERKRDVFFYRKLVENVVFLKNKAYICIAVGVKMLLREGPGGLALDQDLTFIVTVQTAQHIQKCGFTAASMSDYTDKFTFCCIYAEKCLVLLQ